MTRRRFGIGPVRGARRIAGGVLGLALLVGGGCQSTAPYAGPPIAAIVLDDVYAVRVNAPTPGWEVSLDRTERTADARRLYLTLTEPNPEFLYATVIVEQVIATEVGSSENVELFGRVRAYGDTDDLPYGAVEDSENGG